MVLCVRELAGQGTFVRSVHRLKVPLKHQRGAGTICTVRDRHPLYMSSDKWAEVQVVIINANLVDTLNRTPSIIPSPCPSSNGDDGDGDCVDVQALTALKMEAPIFPKAVGWRQNFEFPVPRPAAGAAAANVSLKFYSTSKVSFRVRGTEAATDWTTPEASKGICGGAWVTYPAQTPVTVAFKVQPETATAAGPTVSAAATGGGVVAPAAGVRASGVVLEWKGAEWFQGFVVFYLVKVA